jgi:hypothetical protein
MSVYSTGLHAAYRQPPAKATQIFSATGREKPLRWLAQVLDRDGYPIAQLNGKIGRLIWTVDGHGQTEINITRSEAQRLRGLLEFGNLITVEFDRIPMWAGVIMPPLEMSADGTRLRAFTLEWLLQYDLTPPDVAWTGLWGRRSTSIGYDLLRQSMALQPYLLAQETPYADTGLFVEVTFNYETISAAMELLRKQDSRFRYSLYPVMDRGRPLQVVPQVWRNYRRDMTGSVFLRQGNNLSAVQIVEQGPIVNRVTVAPQDARWPSDSLYFVTHVESDSVRRHGPLSEYITLSEYKPGAVDINKLAQIAQEKATERAGARRRFQAVALDYAPSRFGDYWLGDRVTVEMQDIYDYGLRLAATVRAIEYDPATGYIGAVFEEEAAEMAE